MITFDLSQYRKAKIWTECPSGLACPSEWIEERQYSAAPRGDLQERFVAVEALIPTGPKYNYGLLGARYLPSESSTANVKISVSTSTEYLIDWSLSLRSDTVYAGLLPEYVDGICKALNALGTKNRLPSGALFFDCAAQIHRDKWENQDLARYLEALGAWTQDMDGYFLNRDLPVLKEPSWQVLAHILMAATLYE